MEVCGLWSEALATQKELTRLATERANDLQRERDILLESGANLASAAEKGASALHVQRRSG